MADQKRQKTGKTLCLFDVDGTLTVPRKVRACEQSNHTSQCYIHPTVG
jgi:hypothetical protein